MNFLTRLLMAHNPQGRSEMSASAPTERNPRSAGSGANGGVSRLTDEELVERFRDGDKTTVVGEFVNRYADRVLRLALRVTRNEQDAQEVLQNVFLTLLEKLSTFRGESKFSSWLYRVALNASYMHVGSKSRRTGKEISLEDYAPYNEYGMLEGVKEKGWSDLPDEDLLSREGMEIIEKAIEELPTKYRVVFHLGDVEGLSDQEVADALDLTLSATKSRKRRARLFLRDKLSDYYYEWRFSKESK